MSKFETFLDVRIHKNKSSNRELLHDFIYVSNILSLIRVPKGFKTDFASIPNIFRPFFPINYFAYAATIHDYLYRDMEISRKMADDIFLEAALISVKNKFLAKLAYRALRIGGQRAYNRSRQ